MIDKQLSHFALDHKKFDIFKTSSPQRFARNDVLVHQSINHDQRLLEAIKILSSGGSLFMEEQKRRYK